MTDSRFLPPPSRRRGDVPCILVVEDEEPLRRVTTRVLEGHGYRVVSAGDGMEALAVLDRGVDSFNLVLTGVSMPLLSGIALYRELRRRGSIIPILVVSGGATAHIHAELRADRLARFLAKPWTVGELLGAVGEMLAGDRPSSSA